MIRRPVRPHRAVRSHRAVCSPLAIATAALLAPIGAAVPVAAQAQQATLAVAVDQTADPLLANLTIPANAADAGMWSGVVAWPLVAIHATLLPDGRVLTFGSPPGGNVQDGRKLTFWDPRKGVAANAFLTLNNAQNVDSFCATATLLSDGRLLTSGGASGTSGYSSRESMVLDWKTSTATRDYDLTAQRWYATMTKLPDGRAIITGGGAPYASANPDRPEAANDISSTPEVYTPRQGWRSLVGAYSTDAFGAKNARWWYPRQWVSPAGTLFGVSTEKMWEMKLDGNGSIRTVGNFKTAADTNTRPNVGPTSTAVMYDTGKILQVGGNGYYNGYGTNSSAAASVFDITGIASGRVTVTDTAAMAYPRQWANATVLPNGRVLVTGGSRYADEAGNNAVTASEIWNPATGRWTTGAAAAVYRGYHSTATLLPGGTVLIAGGGVPGPATNLNAQIYYPPYLFAKQGGASVLAARPKIVSLSTNVLQYGAAFDVQTGTNDAVAEVSLIAVGSVTHSFDSNQRRMKLAFTRVNGNLRVTAPASANLAPPGYYQLTTVNTAGVPSAAVMVAVAAAAPGAPTNTTPTQVPSTDAVQIGYDTRTIAAASDGTLATVNIRNELWVSQMGANWTRLPGTFTDAAAIAADRYYATGTDRYVYRWNGTAWKMVGRDAKTLAAAADGTVVVVNSATGSVWAKTADNDQEAWAQVPGAIAKQVALVKRGSLYMIGADNNVYRSDMVNAPVMVGRNVTAIAASADGTVTVVSGDGTLWRKVRDDAQEAWTQLPGKATAVATPDAARLVYNDAAGLLYSR